MRLLIVSFIIILYSSCTGHTGQANFKGDTLRSGIYDTTSIEISSKVKFPFCGTLYDLPRENCNGNLPPNCCGYSTSLQKGQKTASWGYVSCYNGSSFTWNYSGSLGSARNSFEDIPRQLKNQQKNFSQKKIRCLVYNTETEAYLLEQESYQGNKDYLLTTYGSHNGFYFYLEYRSMNKIISSKDIQPVFRQILQIK